MRHARFTGAVCAIATIGASGALAAGTTGPALRVVRTSPLTIKGVSFRSGEHVRLTLLAPDGTSTRQTTASAGGVFTVVFRTGACGAFGVRAGGSLGSRAVLRFRPVDCNPPRPAP